MTINEQVMKRLGLAGKVSAFICLALGAMAVWSWGAGVGDVFTFGLGAPIAPTTALALLLLSFVIWLQYHRPDDRITFQFGCFGAGVSLLGGLFVILRYDSGWNSPIEDWLYRVFLGSGYLKPRFMSPITGAALALAAATALLYVLPLGRRAVGRWLVRVLSLALSLLGAMQAAALTFARGGVSSNQNPPPMALIAALAFMLLGLALAGLSATTPRNSKPVENLRRTARQWTPFAITVFLTLMIGTISAFYLRHEQNRDRNDAWQLLEAVRKLKQSQIAQWREERMNDAKFFSHAEFVVSSVQQFLKQPLAHESHTDMRRWLTQLKAGDRYSVVALLDTSGSVRLTVPKSASTNLIVPQNLIAEALRTRTVVMSDLHRDRNDRGFVIDMVIPVLRPAGNGGDQATAAKGSILGIIVLRIDPRHFLYPTLQAWPTPSHTAETVLFRREGKELVFLNPMRFWTNDLAAARFPLTTNSQMPSVRAILDNIERVEGRDYRGVPVAAHVRQVPDTPWYLLAKVDRDEVYGPLRTHAWLTLTLTVVLITAIGFVAGFINKRQQAADALRQLATERQRREMAERVEYLMHHANDAILLADGDDLILEANDRAQELYGYSLAEMRGMKVIDLRAPETRASFLERDQALLATGQTVFETLNRRKDGSVFPVEVSVRLIKTDDTQLRLGIVRDTTQRKAHEREIERLSRLYATLSQINQSIVRVHSREELFNDVCRITVEYGGFKAVWIGWHDREAQAVRPVAQAGNTHGYLDRIKVRADDSPEGQGPVGTCIRENRPCVLNDLVNDGRAAPWHETSLAHELRAVAAMPIHFNGAVCGAFAVYADEVDVFQDKEIELLEETARDISFALDRFAEEDKRRQVEEAVRKSEESLGLFISHAPVALAMFDRDMRYLAVSRRWLADFQLTGQDIIGRSYYAVLPEIPESWKAAHRRGLEGEVVQAEEDYLERADGKSHWLRWAVRPWRKADGSVGGIIIFSEEITERKRAEKAVRESEQRFRSVVKLSPVAMRINNLNGDIIYLNDHFTLLFGYTMEDVPTIREWRRRAYPDENYRHEVDESWAAATDEAARAGSEIKPHTYRVTCKDGTVRVVEASGTVVGESVFTCIIDVTERKRTEDALLQQLALQDQLAKTAATVPGMIFSFRIRPDGTSCMPYASGALEEIFGLNLQDVARDAAPAFAIIHPDDLPAVNESIAESAKGMKHWRAEFRVRHPQRGELWIEGHSVPQREADGGSLWHGFLQDITERKRAEAVLRETDARLRYLSDNLPNCMLYQMQTWRNGRRRFTYVSNAVRQLHGCSPEEALEDAARIYAQVHEEDRARLKADEEKAHSSRSVFNTELRMRAPDGSIRWMQFISTPRPLGDGSLSWDGIEIDITERKRAQEQLRKLSQAVEQSPASILITDLAGNIEYVNPKFTALTGYPLEEIRGQNPRILKSGVTSSEEYRQLWETVKAGKVWHGELHNRKKTGELFWESAAICPVVDEAGKITHYLAVKEDITERKRLGEQLRQSQKMDAIGQLAGGVAHDFNNILAASMMHLELLRQRSDLAPDLRASLNDLMSHTQRAASLTRQLLLFSRRSVMQLQVLDLNEVVESLLKMLRRIIGETITLEWQGKSKLPHVSGDAGMLDQVIMNLVVNARDAMPNGGSITISTDLAEVDASKAATHPEARPGQFVRLSVADTGCGMDETIIRRIFEPFFTTKAEGKGTGLGLATVYGITRQHQGWVSVESEVGRGSTFQVYLPARLGAKAPSGAAPEEQVIRKGHETILLVEDDASVRKATGSVLRHFGYKVIEAANGHEALKQWESQQGKIDLLFTDMVMPEGMSGLQVTERLRVIKPSLKVVISSGYSTDLLKESDLQGKGIVFLPKPCPSSALAAAVRRALEKS